MRISSVLIFLVLALTLLSPIVGNGVEVSANPSVVAQSIGPPANDLVENNETVRHVNLLENSGFEEGFQGWQMRVGYGNITIDNETFRSGQKSLRIERSKYGYGYASQKVHINSGETPRSFLVSAWARSEGATADNPYFDLLVGIAYEDGTAKDLDVEFSHGTHDWEKRFMSFSVDTSKKLKHIQIFVRFQDRAGTVWFDDLYFAWVDTYVNVQCVDEASKSVANASVEVYHGFSLLEEKQTDDNGSVHFLLPGNKTFMFAIYWVGILVAREYVSVTQDVELLFSISTEMREVTLLLRDFFGQHLSNSDVEVFCRPLTSGKNFSVGQFLTGANGDVEVLLPKLEEWFEITVFLADWEEIHKAKKVTTLNPNTSILLSFHFVKLGGRIFSLEEFVLYTIVAVFAVTTVGVVSYDIYKWKKRLRLFGQSDEGSERRMW